MLIFFDMIGHHQSCGRENKLAIENQKPKRLACLVEEFIASKTNLISEVIIHLYELSDTIQALPNRFPILDSIASPA